MGANTKIEWCDFTFNPWWGCTKVSPACDHCYAESFAKRTGNQVWGKDAPRRFLSEAYWAQPLKWNRDAAIAGERRRVFCASMADVMEDRPDLIDPRTRLYDMIRRTPLMDWLLLTKRPQNFRKLLPSLWVHDRPQHNVWLMTTVESKEFMWRVECLTQCPAVIHGVSYEPALGPVDFSHYLNNGLDWVITGGESGGGSRPSHPDWFRSVRDQCAETGTPFLFKQNGGWASVSEVGGSGGHYHFPDGATVRRIGKAHSGRLLDGREHNEFPVVRQ